MSKSINVVVAEALRAYMGDRWTQVQLAKAAGVSPNTVGNCLNPDRRELGANGKEPSVKLTELAMIAEALGVTVADLVVDLADAQRVEHHRRRAADHYAAYGELPDWAPKQTTRTGTHG